MGLCGVVLAAGRGTRLAPLAGDRPKPSFPIGSVTLLQRAIDTIQPFVDEVAVNFSAHADWFRANLPSGIERFDEGATPLGTAGAIVNMRSWINGRNVVVLNADSIHFGDVGPFITKPATAATRLLTTLDRTRPDFDGAWRFTGLSYMDASVVEDLNDDAEDLYHDLWKAQRAAGVLDTVPFAGIALDSGTPLDLLAANLMSTAGESLIERGAVVEGMVISSVVLRGATIARGETVRNCIAGPAGRFAFS